jgi:hypothetical protein
MISSWHGQVDVLCYSNFEYCSKKVKEKLGVKRMICQRPVLVLEL